ncbi:hypothetical protein GPECTOR_83g307 [Gonium pectorale]|uniref:JmjC domain-containing protein n=1 Tax=Gonium pectorale TaxID=33097 RepID=A0A150G2F9_GONPE|nr:hypothetical protein GPECTOR_83g307 [Gonium pectorale]|eukprot:KXZ43695.1 hypothetical protein GPECTOR_83g307 [Gonium pectorale]
MNAAWDVGAPPAADAVGAPAPAPVTLRACCGGGVGVEVDVAPLLGWRGDEEVQTFLKELSDAHGGPAVEAFVRLLEAAAALVQPLTGPQRNGHGRPGTHPNGAAVAAPDRAAAATAAGSVVGAACAGVAAGVHARANSAGNVTAVAAAAAVGASGAAAASDALSLAAALVELCWEKLHLGYWKDVALAWRNGYGLACLVDVTLRLMLPLRPPDPSSQEPPASATSAAAGRGPDTDTGRVPAPSGAHSAAPGPATAAPSPPPLPLLRRCLRQLDLGLMMGGPLWRQAAQGLVDRLHEAAAAAEAAAPGAAGAAPGREGARAGAPPLEDGTGGGRDGSAGMDDLGEPAAAPPAKRQCLQATAAAADGGAAGGGGVRLPPGSLGGPPGCRVPACEAPGLEEFLLEYMGTGEPVVVTGAMEHWPALSRWQDMSYLVRAAGLRTVPVEVGRHYLADGWGQQLMPLADFLRTHILHQACPASGPAPTPGAAAAVATPAAALATGPEGHSSPPPPSAAPPPPPLGYLAQHPLFDQIPALRADIATPDYCSLGEFGELVAVNAWLGPAGTTTPLHTDPHHNLLAQVVGRKYVRLYAPALTPHLKPFPAGSVNSNSSQVDLDELAPGPEGPDLRPESDSGAGAVVWEEEGAAEHDVDCGAAKGRRTRGHLRFSSPAALPFLDVVLEPGHMLYIPPSWWHFVRSLGTSFSVSFWWR